MGTEGQPKTKPPRGLKKWLKKKRQKTAKPEDQQELVRGNGRSIEVQDEDSNGGERWEEVDLASSRERIEGSSEHPRPSTSFGLEEAGPGVSGWGNGAEETNGKKKKKFRPKKIRKSTWRAMKGGWKYFKAGLILFTGPVNAFNVPGAAAHFRATTTFPSR